MQLHQKDQVLVKTMKRFDLVVASADEEARVPRLDVGATLGLRTEKREGSGVAAREMKEEEARIRSRLSILTSLSRNYDGILEAARTRECRRRQLKEKLEELEGHWRAGPDLESTDARAIARHSNKVAVLAGEIHHENSVLGDVHKKCEVLKKSLTEKQDDLRQQIVGFQSRMRERQPGGTPAHRGARDDPSPLMALLESIPRSNALLVPVESPKTIDQRAASILDAVRKDTKLHTLLECNAPYLNALARFPRTPDLLEGLAADPTVLSIEHLKPENVGSGPDGSSVLESLTSLVAAWIGANDSVGKVTFQDCTLSDSSWLKVAESFITAHEAQELSIIRSEMTPDSLKQWLRCIRRSCLTTLDLGYNNLGAEGAELLFLSLTSAFSADQDSTPLSNFGSSSAADPGSYRPEATQKQAVGAERQDSEDDAMVSAFVRRHEMPKRTALPDGLHMGGGAVIMVNPDSEDAETLDDLNTGRRHVGIAAEAKQIGTPGGSSGSLLQPGHGSVIMRLHSKMYPKVCETLTDLLMPVNQLRDEGARTLARLLKMRALPNLACLDLRWNEIGVEGAAAFASTFQALAIDKQQAEESESPRGTGTHPLRLVNLAGNRVQDAGATSMVTAMALSGGGIVDTLDLSMNQIGNEILTTLLNLVGNPQTYNNLETTTVSLEWNEVDDGEAVQRLAATMAKQPVRDMRCSDISVGAIGGVASPDMTYMRTTLSPREPETVAMEMPSVALGDEVEPDDYSRRVEGWATKDFEQFQSIPFLGSRGDDERRMEFRSTMLFVDEEGSEGGRCEHTTRRRRACSACGTMTWPTSMPLRFIHPLSADSSSEGGGQPREEGRGFLACGLGAALGRCVCASVSK
eukprot:Polyplicarium_translucidae@DN2225_c0_g1_i5.p1